ncbi:glycosyl hydrolase [Chitinophaga lutea]|nr:glycosyl hydrolase [Chitinophaga lutea]
MQRRDFLKNTLITATGMLVWPALSRGGNAAEVLNEAGFLRPPAHCRPQVLWIWLNGHVTEEGIRKDLEAMRQMGLGGALLFNTEGAVPRGPVDMGGTQWRSLMLYTMQEAQRLQLQIMIHNSAGFSGTGGSFVQPQQSMQQLVWRTVKAAPGQKEYSIPPPFTKLGYYRDIAVVAFPELPVPALRKLMLNGKEEQPDACFDQDPETALRLEKTGDIVFEFAEEGAFQSVTIWRKPEVPRDVYDGPPDSPPTFQLESAPDGINYSTVCTIVMPQLRKMNAPGAAVFPAVKTKFFRLRTNISTWLSEVQWHAHAAVTNWPGKANFYQHVAESVTTATADEGIDKKQVLDLTNLLQPNGTLQWEPPSGHWTILRIGHTATGQLGASQPDAAVGLELDKFSRDAVDGWFRHMDEYLFNALQRYPSCRGLLIDSWEVGVQNWTQRMPEAFLQQHDYAISQWLPALTGRIVGNAEATNAFLFDFRRTQATLVAKEYYAGFKTHCNAKGWQLWGEPYGDGMFDSLQISQSMDLPMGEFWTRYAPGTMNSIGVALSAGHTAGKRVIGAEAFTGLPETSRWTEYPYALKVQGDHFYSLGINQLMLSVMVHQPYAHGLPGFCMGPFGSHFDRTNTWAAFTHGWTSYLTRTQYMLQQGHYAADFVFFKGEESAASIPDIDHVMPNSPTGYGADVIGPDALFQDIQIRDHRIVFPDGMTYNVMVMIQLRKVSLPVLQRLKELVEAGMLLAVNEKPESPPGLSGDAAALRALADEIWGDLDGIKVKERKLGKGTLYRNKLLADIVQLPPDFRYTSVRRDAAIRFTHRRTADADIYFVSNRLRRHERVIAEFRIKGMLPELWNAEDGSITEAAMYQPTDNGIRVPLEFTPTGSWLVVFRKPLPGKGIEALTQNGELLCSALPAAVPAADYWAQVQQTFSIEVWIKPDTYAMPGKGYVVYPPEGEQVYGKGYACAGIAAGQNVIRICERTKGAAYFSKDVVAVYQPVSGWTHVVAVYHDGIPALYINGKLAGRGVAGEYKVIPGLGTKPTGELHSSVFEGNATEPALHREALGPEKIAALYAAKLPAPALPDGLLLRRQGKRVKALAWQNGNYHVDGYEINVKDKCAVQTLKGAWQLQFEPGRGAPASMRLPELISLHRHTDFNVRHFAGVVTYKKQFHITPVALQKGKRVFLDLGRVEVLADVSINGKKAGMCWKEPYRIDITSFIRAGDNSMSIQVATLWPNRQIGDEQLPAENAYTPSHYIATMPEWFVQNKSNPGRRVTFATWNNYKPEDPLLEAGLLGPVRLITAWELQLPATAQ